MLHFNFFGFKNHNRKVFSARNVFNSFNREIKLPLKPIFLRYR